MFDNIFSQLNFYLALLIFSLVFTGLLTKQPYFWVKLLPSAAIGFVIAYFFPAQLEDSLSTNAFIHSLYISFRYITLFVYVVLAVKLCYKSTWWQTVYCATAAYCFQHILYKSSELIFEAIKISLRQDSIPPQVYYPIYFALFAAIGVVSYFLYVNRLRSTSDLRTDNKKVIIFSFIVIIATTYLNSLFYVLYYIFSILSTGNRVLALIVSFSFPFLLCVCALENLVESSSNKKHMDDIVLIQSILKNDRKKFELSKQNSDMINIKYHDLKYLLSTASIDKNSMLDIKNLVETHETIAKTGNGTLDVVLFEKISAAASYDIKIKCVAKGQLLDFISDVDIYSFFGNAIDNAIESLKTAPPEERTVYIDVDPSGDMVKIQFENYSASVPVMTDNLPNTTKIDKENHGFGLKSIKYIVEKYKGHLLISTENQKFTLIVMIPLPKANIA